LGLERPLRAKAPYDGNMIVYCDSSSGGKKVNHLTHDRYCRSVNDGVCDDGGPGSEFSDCDYGYDCQDCCPRNPFEGYETRYAGEYDTNLTRAVCNEESITITQESVCLIQFNWGLNVAPAILNNKEITMLTVVLSLLLISLVVVAVMVPLVVYSQLVYSGRWPVLTCCEAIKCVVTGDFTRTAEAEEAKNRAHAEKVRLLSESFMDKRSDKSSCCALYGHFPHMEARSRDIVKKYNLPESLLSFVRLITFALHVVTLEIVFDIFPVRYDTRYKRVCFKIFRLIFTTVIIGILLMHAPAKSISALGDVIACVIGSCQDSGWREKAPESELVCGVARSQGLIQPSFWSDLVDIVQASLSLAVLTLLGEWKEGVEGKNLVGAGLLAKVDIACGQEKDSKTNLPKGQPTLTYSVYSSRKGDASHKLDKKKTIKLLESLANGPKLDLEAKQKEMIAAVNVGSSAAKLTMAQLFSAVGSIIAIIASARDYDSNCLLNVALFENTTADQALTRNTSSSIFGWILNRNDEHLEVLILKPSKSEFISLALIFRATLGNLTLLIIGIALKNFITRTATAKAHVDSMLRKADPDHEINTDVITVILMSISFGWQSLSRSICCLLQGICCMPFRRTSRTVDVDQDDVEDLLEKQPDLDEAAKQNARSIVRVYQLSSIAMCIIIYWYGFVICISFVNLFSLIPVMTLICVAFFTLVPLLNFIAKPIKMGCGGNDIKKIDSCVYVVQAIIVLRSFLVASHSMMMRAAYGSREASLITWESYWSNGDASEKLLYMLTFDLYEMFNFEFNLIPKILSFVVIAIELVVLIGSNIQSTAIVRLFCRRCQPCCFNVAFLATKLGVLAHKVKGMDIDPVEIWEKAGELMENGKLMDAAMDAAKSETKRRAKQKLTNLLKPHLPENSQEELLQMLSKEVEVAIDKIESVNDLAVMASELLNDLDQFLQKDGISIPQDVLLAIAKAWLANKLTSQLQADGDDNASRSKIKKDIDRIMAKFASKEDVWKAADQLAKDPVKYISDLKSELSDATSTTAASATISLAALGSSLFTRGAATKKQAEQKFSVSLSTTSAAAKRNKAAPAQSVASGAPNFVSSLMDEEGTKAGLCI